MLGLARRKRSSIKKEGEQNSWTPLLYAILSHPLSLLLLREKVRPDTFFFAVKWCEWASSLSTCLFRGITCLFLLPDWSFPLRTQLLNDLHIWVANKTNFLYFPFSFPTQHHRRPFSETTATKRCPLSEEPLPIHGDWIELAHFPTSFQIYHQDLQSPSYPSPHTGLGKTEGSEMSWNKKWLVWKTGTKGTPRSAPGWTAAQGGLGWEQEPGAPGG